MSMLDRAFASTSSILAKVQPDHLALPTPCASWDVRMLISHFTGSARWAAAMISGGEPDTGDAAGDFTARYEESIRAALSAFGADGALDRTVSLPFAELTGAGLMVLCAREQFTHGWDLARAIGLPADLDPDLADELLTEARGAGLDAFRGPDGTAFFGAQTHVPPGAGAADRLAAFLGRAV
jgi:uncharacterized protein (TIGR03086 family)